MALEYATEHLRGALLTLASSEGTASDRLQKAWVDNIQMLWETMCLPDSLNADFRDLWERYTAPSDDRHATKLRGLGGDELSAAITGVIDLALAATAADARGDEPARST